MSLTRKPLVPRSAQQLSLPNDIDKTEYGPMKKRYGRKATASNRALFADNFVKNPRNEKVNLHYTDGVLRDEKEEEENERVSKTVDDVSDKEKSSLSRSGQSQLRSIGRHSRFTSKTKSIQNPRTSNIEGSPTRSPEHSASSGVDEHNQLIKHKKSNRIVSIDERCSARVSEEEEQHTASQHEASKGRQTELMRLEEELDQLAISGSEMSIRGHDSKRGSSSPAQTIDLPRSKQHLRPLVQESNQKRIDNFQDWGSEIAQQYDVLKVAEGSYGEVFKIIDRDGLPSSPVHSVRALGGCILKVIPINAVTGAGSRKFSHAKDVAKEVQMLKTMDAVHGFTRYRDVYVLEGRMHQSFLNAWKRWRSDPSNDSQLPDPSDPSSYTGNQIWAVIEMDDAGKDLETLKTPSIYQIYDLFWSVTFSLAYGEQIAEFEHRDLHVGNICFRPQLPGGLLDIDPVVSEKMDDALETFFGLSNIRATIIDYTLSRAVINTDDTAWTALKSKSLLQAEGDTSEEKCQREAGRRMLRAVDAAMEGKPQSTNTHWGNFVPRTNVVWLAYLLEVLLARTGSTGLPNSSDTSLSVQKTLTLRLKKTLRALRAKDVGTLPESASALKEIAIEKGWLTDADVETWIQQCNK